MCLTVLRLQVRSDGYSGDIHVHDSGENVPTTIDPHEGIKAFAATISRQQLGLAYHRPEPWARVLCCFANAAEKVRREGDGVVLYGWTFHYRVAEGRGGYLFATHHAVWKAPKGWLIDVTPFHEDPKHHPYTQGGDVLFLVDDAARPVVIRGEITALPLCYFALDDDPRLLEYVDGLRWEEERKCKELYDSMAGPRSTVKKIKRRRAGRWNR
jgi:hypothetical protein